MYRRYYRETPPGYSGVRFTDEEEKGSSPALAEEPPLENGEPIPTKEAVAKEEVAEEVSTREAYPLPPCLFTCTKREKGECPHREKEAAEGDATLDGKEKGSKKEDKREEIRETGGAPRVRESFSLEDLLLVASLVLLLSGEVEEETLLLVGLLILLLGK